MDDTGTGNIEPIPGSAPSCLLPHRPPPTSPFRPGRTPRDRHPDAASRCWQRRPLWPSPAPAPARPTPTHHRTPPSRSTTATSARGAPLVLLRHRPARRDRRPALHHHPGRTGQPVGRRHRPGRRAADRRRRIHPRLRRSPPPPAPRVKAVLQLGSAPYTTYASVDAPRPAPPAGRADLHRPGRQPERPTRLPGRRRRRRADHLPGQRLAARRRAARRRTCRTPARGCGSTRSATCPAARRTPPWSPRRPTALPWQLRRRRPARSSPAARTTPRGVDAASGQNVQTVDFSAYRTAGHRLHARRRRRDQPPVRHLRGPLRRSCAPTRCSSSTPSAAASPIDGDLIGAGYARAGRPPRRRPQPGRHRACPASPASATTRLRRARRLVRRRRPRQVRGQRRHRRLPAAERLRADLDAPPPTAARAGRRHAAACPSAATACRTSSTRRAGSWSSCCACRCRPASRWPAWPTTRSTTRAGPACRSPRQDDPQPRELHPPSTAATLNLAAAAAQCARLFAPYDAAFAARCLARRADRLRRGQGPPGDVRRPGRRHRRRRVRRQQRHRRVLLGGRRAVPDHRRRRPTGRPDRLAAPHRRRVRRRRASAGRASPRSAGSTWPPCRTGCPPPTWPGSAPR